jgi:hypothetical protein
LRREVARKRLEGTEGREFGVEPGGAYLEDVFGARQVACDTTICPPFTAVP